MKDKVCLLCMRSSPNMKSHILAKGILKLIDIGGDQDYLILSDEYKRSKRRPTGSYDKSILCDKCDSMMGDWDLEAIKFCKSKLTTKHPSNLAWLISGIDQDKLKLFFMSYIWRASVTDLEEFKGCNIGSIHEERIRQLLLKSTPGSVDDYSVLLYKFSIPDDKEKWGKTILIPINNRFKGYRTVDVYSPNLYKAFVKVDSRPYSDMDFPTKNQMMLGTRYSIFVTEGIDYLDSQEFKMIHNLIKG